MLKKTLYFLCLLTCFIACKKDEELYEDANLHYDGANQTAPVFNVGTYEALARFTVGQTTDLQGQSLEEIAFYILNEPTTCQVVIYGQGTAEEPGDLIYSRDINDIDTQDWNYHTLDNSIEINEEDLWIGVRLYHESDIASIGCDSGPANINGDWLWADGDNEWTQYRVRTDGSVNVNWNIRGIVR